jgi:hypothetical protein
VGQVGNLRADCQSALTARVNNPLQDDILPHILNLIGQIRTERPRIGQFGQRNLLICWQLGKVRYVLVYVHARRLVA